MTENIQVRNSVKTYTMGNKSATHDPKTDENPTKGKRFNSLLYTSSENRIKKIVAFSRHDTSYRDKQR
jgi:hypothetical protein